MRSMTGIGVGVAKGQGVTVRAELRSVNHRFLDLVVRMPAALTGFEADARKQISSALDRGRVTLNVELERSGAEVEVSINESFVESFVKNARRVARKHELDPQLDLTQILALPEAMSVRETQIPSTAMAKLLREATDQALQRFQKMREKEGAALAKDLRRRLKVVAKHNKEVRKHAAKVPGDARRRLEERLEKLGASDAVDPSRLAAEVALLADRASVAEEVDRMESHLKQFAETVIGGGPTAKRLGFLLQEMHREVNTMGSKSVHLPMTNVVLRMKEEIENLREQIQNLE